MIYVYSEFFVSSRVGIHLRNVLAMARRLEGFGVPCKLRQPSDSNIARTSGFGAEKGIIENPNLYIQR
jgi:hypothetical protein